MAARIVQVFFAPDTDHIDGIFGVLCEDGSMYERIYKHDGYEHSAGNSKAINPRFEWVPIEGPKS